MKAYPNFVKRMGLWLSLIMVSLGMGWGLANAQTSPATPFGIDPVPAAYQLGQRLYVDNCSRCHMAIPPEIFPTQTWQQVLASAEHYGTTIALPPPFDTEVIGQYLQEFSRSLYVDEATPYRAYQSRFFKALHPQIDFPPAQPRLGTCVTCHPGANERNFRRLSPDWQD